MSDFFKSVNSKVNLKYVNNIIDPVIYKNNDNPVLTFLIDKYISQSYLKKFLNFLNKIIPPNYPFQILYIFPFEMPQQKNNIINFYKNNKINLEQHIPQHSKIISCGRAIYAITESDELNVKSFYDFIFNDTYFYVPYLKSFVFPIDNLDSWLFSDNFQYMFAMQQIELALNFKVKPIREIKLNFYKIDSLEDFVKEHEKDLMVAWDTETTGLDYFKNDVGCITFSFDGVNGYYLDFNKDKHVDLLSKFFENKIQIGTNLKFDIHFLRKYGVKNLHIDFDTYQAGHLLNEMRSNSLKTHSWIYTYHGGYNRELENYKEKYHVKNYMEIPENIRLPYATMDAIITYQVAKKMQLQMDKIDKEYPMDNDWSLNDYYYKIMIPALNMYIDIEEEGMCVDWNKVREIGKEIELKIKDIKKQIYDSFGVTENDLNINSGQQLGLFLEHRGWSKVEKSKTIKHNKVSYYYKTNENCLLKWEREGHKEAGLLLKYRELETLHKTFIGNEKEKTGIWQYKKSDGKIYPEYLVMVANSHRNRAKNPNSQNWPKHGDYAKLIRSIFITPSEDYLIGEVDASGFQLRIGAILSQDQTMKKIFTELSGDMHSMTAQQILKSDISLEEFLKRKNEPELKEIRFKAKTINFSLIFGSSAYSFALESLLNEWSLNECKKYIKENKLEQLYEHLVEKVILKKGLHEKHKFENRDIYLGNVEEGKKFCYYWTVAIDIRNKFLDTYSGIAEFIKNSISYAEQHGFVRSPFGAIRRLPQLLYSKEMTSSELKNLRNISINSPVQNFEIAVIHLGMVDLHNYIKEHNLKSRLFGMVHDSILLYVYKPEIDLLKEVIPKIFGKKRKEYKDIPIIFEGELSDPRKGEVWGFGKEWF